MTSRTDEPMTWRYQRDAEQTRHRIADGLDELNNRLTPGQVFDEMLTYARGGSGTFFRALSNASRENPIPSLLIAAGAMMFLSEKMGLNRYIASGSHDANGDSLYTAGVGRHSSARRSNAASSAVSAAASGVRTAADSVRSGARSAADYAGEQASNVADSIRKGADAVGGTVSSAVQQAREAVHDLGDQAADAGQKIKRGAQSLSDSVQDYSAAARDQVANAAERATTETVRSARQAKDTMVSFVHEQPLLSAAIGLAVGAAIAAILPSTETEDELMGEKADAVKDAVSEVASDQFQKAKTAAGNVAQEAMSAAQREGLGTSQIADAAKDISEKVKTVVSKTATAAESEIRDLAANADKKM
jgi:ElaB/YqjD/DUF883 family membrane-anchored ribosome-binding protein